MAGSFTKNITDAFELRDTLELMGFPLQIHVWLN